MATTEQPLEPGDVTEEVEDAYDEGETLPGGDVPSEIVAERLGICPSQVRKHLARLADAGEIERTFGFKKGVGRVNTYRPASRGESDDF